MSKEKYPIGKFKPVKSYTEADLKNWMEDLRTLPSSVNKLVIDLDDDALETSYRDGGWTIQQVVHHLADSHINMYFRVRLALTNSKPTIIPYDQDSWALLIDAEEEPVSSSIDILSGIHSRLIHLFKNLRHGEFERAYYHPEDKKDYKLWEVVALYAWHSNHHLAHIKQGIARIE